MDDQILVSTRHTANLIDIGGVIRVLIHGLYPVRVRLSRPALGHGHILDHVHVLTRVPGHARILDRERDLPRRFQILRISQLDRNLVADIGFPDKNEVADPLLLVLWKN